MVLGLVEDHPRIRGEHASFQMALRAARGSSPHTRGARDDVIIRLVHVRIIPAYAGSTSQRYVNSIYPADHPRIRGEHLRGTLGLGGAVGSSPHTRGARCRCR